MTAASTSNVNDDARSVAGTDASSMVRVEIMSNADLYAMTPPAYTQSVADGETSVDAEAVQPEKVGMPGTSYTRDADADTIRSVPVTHDEGRAEAHGQSQAGPSNAAPPSSSPTDQPPNYFAEMTSQAAVAHVKPCSVLPDRPAVWLVKRKNMALSPLAATILVKEGLVRAKDLELISANAGVKRDPTDPLSAVAFGVYDTVGDVLLGLVQGPVELGRQVQPMFSKYEAKQHGNQTPNVRHSVRQETSPLARPDTAQSTSSEQASLREEHIQLRPDGSIIYGETNCYSDAKKEEEPSALKTAPHAAAKVAVGTGKGLGRIVGAGFKAPMTFSHGLTRGFHNLPKLYGEEVREYENVTDIRSGLLVSAKGFGYGVGDGLKDFFVKPIEGAQKEGVVGFGKGVGKGIGNLVCKPTAGMVGIVGYSSVGVYKQIRGITFSSKDSTGEAVRKIGEAEYEQSNEDVKLNVVKKWCQFMMRQKS